METLSAVVPAGDGSRQMNLAALLDELRSQSLPPGEIEVVRGVSPNGRARNIGAAKTTGEILVFLDDDVRLGGPELLRAFVECLHADASLGMVGAAQLLPPDSTRFQRRCARQMVRMQSPVVHALTESDMVTTACCAMRRAVLEEVGGFHDRLIRGVDSELRHRVRQACYRIAVVPNASFYHPLPPTPGALLRRAWRDGAASAYARRFFPEAIFFNPDGHVAQFEARRSLTRRALRNIACLSRDVVCGRTYGALYGLTYLAANLYGTVQRPNRQGR